MALAKTKTAAQNKTVFLVQSKTSVREPGGGYNDDWVDKFSLSCMYSIRNERKLLESGAFAIKTYCDIKYRYEADKAIAISDKVIINGDEYVSTTESIPDNPLHPRFFTITLTK